MTSLCWVFRIRILVLHIGDLVNSRRLLDLYFVCFGLTALGPPFEAATDRLGGEPERFTNEYCAAIGAATSGWTRTAAR